MPPKKKNTAHTLKKQREKERKEADKKAKKALEDQLIPQKHFIPPPPKEKTILITGAKESKIREIFKVMNETPTGDIDNLLRSVLTEPGLDRHQKKFLLSFQLKIPKDLYKDYSEEYLATNISYNDFWKYFVQEHIDEIQEKQEKEEEAQDMKDRMADLFGESTDEEDESYQPETLKGDMLPPVIDPEGRTKRKIKFLWNEKDDEWVTADEIGQANKTKYYSEADDTCTKEFKNYPWVSSDGATVRLVYIRSIEDTDISPYITDSQIDYNSNIYYKTNKEFRNLLCQRLFKQEQEGNVLVFTSKRELENIKLKFEVLFITSNQKAIIQDEEIMNAQKSYFKQLRLTREDKINKLRLRPINEEVKEIGMKYLSEKLHQIAPGVLDYGIYKIDSVKYDTDFIKQIILKITKSCHNIECFFSGIADIVVYLNLESIGQGIYRKRIKQEYYLPDVLVELTHKEKLPELFIHGVSIDPEQSAQIDKIIEVKKIAIIHQLLSDVYNLENPGERKPTRSSYGIVSLDNDKFKTDWKVYCSYQEDVKDIDDEDIIHYLDNDDSKIYCFNIKDVMLSVHETGGFLNPRTNRYVSKAFLDQIQSTFDIKPPKEVYDKKDDDSKDDVLPEKHLAKGLLELIIKNIEECEKEFTDEKLNSEGKCHSHDDDADESESESESEDGMRSSSKEPVIQEAKSSVPNDWEDGVLSTPEEEEITALKNKFGSLPHRDKFYKIICFVFKDEFEEGSTCIDDGNIQNMELFYKMDTDKIKEKLNLYKVKYSDTDDNKKLLRKLVKHIENFPTSQGFAPKQGDGKICANPDCQKYLSDNNTGRRNTYFTKNDIHYHTSFCSSQCVSDTNFGKGKQSTGGGRNGATERRS